MKVTKEFFKSKKFIAILVISVLAIAGIVVAVVLTRPDDGMRIRTLPRGDVEQRTIKDYEKSRLWLENGTFRFKVMYHDEIEWIGIGTFQKTTAKYIFTYVDMYRLKNGVLTRASAFINVPKDYEITRDGIAVKTPNDVTYYFK